MQLLGLAAIGKFNKGLLVAIKVRFGPNWIKCDP